MHPIRTLAVLTLAAVLLLFLSACGGRPIALAAIPAFPEATELEPGTSAAADSLAASMLDAVDADLSSEIQRYRLPANTGWEAVETFYADALGDAGWQTSDELRTETAVFSSAGWVRSANSREQVLLLSYYAPGAADGAPLLLVALFGG